MSINTIAASVALVGALLTTGCEATFTPSEPIFTVSAGASVAPVAVVPSDIFSFPRVWFEGSWVYLVDGAWYFPSTRGWFVYTREPIELRRERARIYRMPPRQPAYGYPPPRTAPEEFNRERRPLPP